MFCDRITACTVHHSEMYYNIKVIGYFKYHNQIALKFHICLQNRMSSLNATKSHNHSFTLNHFVYSREVCYVPTFVSLFQ